MYTDGSGNSNKCFKKLRVSLTDACNFRCVYCMPEEVVFSKQNDYLSSKEIISIAKNLNQCGIDEIRLTGGEPTLRPDIEKIISGLSEFNLKKLGLTSNGKGLKQLFPSLLESSCKFLNLSLDSLKADKFFKITRSDSFKEVYTNILTARDFGFKVKINMVVIRGKNNDEILDFVEFALKEKIEVRFLELMNIGVATPHFKKWFFGMDEIKGLIGKRYNLTKKPTPHDSTSQNYHINGDTPIGFIASESHPFCRGCNRLRMDAFGNLRPCLMKSEGTNIRKVDPLQYPEILQSLMAVKPLERLESLKQPMYQVGG